MTSQYGNHRRPGILPALLLLSLFASCLDKDAATPQVSGRQDGGAGGELAAAHVQKLREQLAAAQRAYVAALGNRPEGIQAARDYARHLPEQVDAAALFGESTREYRSPISAQPKAPAASDESAAPAPHPATAEPAAIAPTPPQAEAPASPKQPTDTEHVAELKVELRAAVLKNLEEATSGAVAVAVNRAQVQHLEDELRDIESRFGGKEGNFSSRWNVLSIEDLRITTEQIRADLVALETQKARYPASELPPQLQHCIDELSDAHLSLLGELGARGGTSALPQLKQIEPTLTLAQAYERAPELKSFNPNSNQLERARSIIFELEFRLLRSPEDASLRGVSELLKSHLKAGKGPRPPPQPSALVVEMLSDHGHLPPSADGSDRNVPPGWDLPNQGPRPPPSGSEPPRGPRTPGGAGGAAAGERVAKLAAAVQQEANAIVMRDPVRLAEARAVIHAEARWFQLALPWQVSEREVALSSKSTGALLEMLDSYKRWFVDLHSELETQPDGNAQQELQYVKSAMAEVEAHLERRLAMRREIPPVPHSPEEMLTAAAQAPHSERLGTYERMQPVWQAHSQVVELRAELDVLRPVPDLHLQRVYEQKIDDELAQQADAIEKNWGEATALRRETIIHGRSKEGAKLTGDALDSFAALQRHAAALRTRVNQRMSAGTGSRQTLARANAALKHIPPPLPGAGQPLLAIGDALTQLQHVSDTLHRERARLQQELYVGFANERRAGTADFVRLRQGQDAVPTDATARPLDSFEDLFPQGKSWTTSFRELTSDVRRSPGGVIVDVMLSQELRAKLREVRVDPRTGALTVTLGPAKLRVSPAVPPGVLRTAWAFVQDGRAAVVDLRNLSTTEASWLLQSYGADHAELAGAKQWEQLAFLFGKLTSVNLHPGLVHTQVGLDMIAADEVIFDLLPLGLLRDDGSASKYGLELVALRQAYLQDYQQALQDPALQYRLFDKSIVSVRNVDASVTAGQLQMRAQIEFDLYSLAIEGYDIPPHRLEASVAWFNRQRSALLQHIPALRQLALFAQTVALLRGAQAAGARQNLDELFRLPSPEMHTPRLMCRSHWAAKCQKQEFQKALGLSVDFPPVK